MRTLLAPFLLPFKLFQHDWWSDPQTRWMSIMYSTSMGLAALFLVLMLISKLPIKEPIPTPPNEPSKKSLAPYAEILREGLEGSVHDTGIGWGGHGLLRSIHKHYVMRRSDPTQITIEFPGPKSIGGYWRSKLAQLKIGEQICSASPIDEKPDWGTEITNAPTKGIFRMSAQLCALPEEQYVEVPIAATMQIEFPLLAANGSDFENKETTLHFESVLVVVSNSDYEDLERYLTDFVDFRTAMSKRAEEVEKRTSLFDFSLFFHIAALCVMALLFTTLHGAFDEEEEDEEDEEDEEEVYKVDGTYNLDDFVE